MIRLIQILIITTTFIGCDCSITGPQVFDIGTSTTKLEDYWFPNENFDTIVFVDSLGSELQFLSSKYTYFQDWRFFTGNSSCEEYYGQIEKSRLIYSNISSGYTIDYTLTAGKEFKGSEQMHSEFGQITIRDTIRLVIEISNSDSLEGNSQFDLNGQLINTYKLQFSDKIAHFSKGYGIIYFEDNKGQKWTLVDY